MNICLKFWDDKSIYMWILHSTTASIAAVALYSLAHWQHFHALDILKSSANLALATWHPTVHLHMCRKLSISSSMQMLSATHVGTLMHSFWLPSSARVFRLALFLCQFTRLSEQCIFTIPSAHWCFVLRLVMVTPAVCWNGRNKSLALFKLHLLIPSNRPFVATCVSLCLRHHYRKKNHNHQRFLVTLGERPLVWYTQPHT